MTSIKVMVVDDHAMFGESLAHILSTKAGIDVVGIVQSGEEALKQVDNLRPNIVLMDIEMKNMDGIETTRLIKQKYPDTDVIVLTMHSEEEYMIDAIKAGAKGYILKNSSCASIVNAIKSVMRGEPAFDSNSSTKDVLKNIIELLHYKDTGKEAFLSQKELKILKLISEGCTNKAIGEELHISIHTVRNHITNIFSKLDCSNRTKAVREGQRRRLI